MASAKLTFEVEGVSYTLYFGMASVRIFQERAAKEYRLLIESGIPEPSHTDLDPTKTLANIIYSGLCNMADINDEKRPIFSDVYSLSESLSSLPDIYIQINEVWRDSEPVKEMLDRLKDQSHPEEKKNTNRKTGTKSKHTQQDSLESIPTDSSALPIANM